MLAVRGQQHSFSTHERMFLWKCPSFWDRKCLDLRGTRIHNLRIHAECYNHLSYQGQTFAVPCFWTLALVSGYLVFILCYFQYILCQYMCVFVVSLSFCFLFSCNPITMYWWVPLSLQIDLRKFGTGQSDCLVSKTHLLTHICVTPRI